MKKIVFALLCTLLVGYSGIGQSPGNQDDVPEAAMLTERGQELAKRLHYLRRSEENFGPKHPSLPAVLEEIKQVKEQLQAWAPGKSSSGEVSKPSLQMNDHDLRQVVIKMANKIDQLEERIQKLEKLQLR